MQAGKYWIGDLCYVMSDVWNEFCEITIDGHAVLSGEFALKNGTRFATYTTAYGDGTYPASNGADLGVDAGLIGCIRVEDITMKDPGLDLGTIVTFEQDFTTGSHNGVINFDRFTVDTSCTDEDDVDFSDMDEEEDY